MRRAVVTGGASGIGYATGDLLRESGWRVLLMDIAPGSAQLHEDIEYAQIDIVDVLSAAAAIRRFCGDAGLDALVNNAAVQHTGPTLAAPRAVWDRVMSVNVWAAAALIEQCLPALDLVSGAVVNVASVHAVSTSSNIGVYAASKGALVSLTRSLAIELAPMGIRVNAVLPGAVDTPMLRAGLGRVGGAVDAAFEELARNTVIGRVGEPREVAQAIEFLADGDRSSFITGASLVVDGGAAVRLSTER